MLLKAVVALIVSCSEDGGWVMMDARSMGILGMLVSGLRLRVEGIGTSFACEKGRLVVGRSGLGECTEGSRTPTDSVEERDEDDSFDTSTRETITQHPKKERVAKLIKDFGSAPLGYISYDGGNRVYISGIVERWQPKTNTFHMPLDEMTITLEVVRVLLGISVTSKTVATPFKDRKSVTAMVSRLLEVSVTNADEEIRTRPGLTVSFAWLKDHFSVLKNGEEEPNGKKLPMNILVLIICYYTSDKLRVMNWHHKKEDRLYKKETRLLLDHLVIWDNTLKGAPPVHDIAFYHGPMKFMDIIKPHNPIKVNLTIDEAFQMANQVIAFLSDAEHTYHSTTATASESEGGTTSTEDILHYG
ncbi:hypothetical protein Scep_029859 [Stephania cephalantha]|uniref:Aminotransferase-like plant mobile domain-containing protein n=1 Tax=Stephania cephalantha TaxID=152367 RepID=A0AAP0E1T6_9MAGN